MRDYQSFSSLSTWTRCPFQYHFRYVEGIKIAPAVAMVRGTAGHKGQEINYKQKVESRKDAPEDVVLDATRDAFVERSKEVEDWEDKKPGQVQDGLIHLMKIVHKDIHPKVQPIAAEKSIIIDIPVSESETRKLKMVVDCLAEDGVHDSKFTGKKKSQSDADRDLQLTMYSYAERDPRVCFDLAIETKAGNQGCAQVRSERTEDDWTRLEARIPRVIKAVESGVLFPPDPTSWWCSERMCGYWHICEHGGKKRKITYFDVKSSDILMVGDRAIF